MISVETLDGNNWIPIELLYNSTRTLPISCYTQQYTTGFALHYNTLLDNVLDVNVQYDAFTALIPFRSLTGCFVEQYTTTQPNFISNNVLLTYQHDYALVYNSTSAIPVIAPYDGTQAQYHRLVFNGDKLQIMYNDVYLLTVQDDLTLSYKLPLYAFPDKQLFNFSLSGNQLAIFTALESLTSQRVVRFDSTQLQVVLASGAFVSGDVIDNHDFWTLPVGNITSSLGFDYSQYSHQYYNQFGPTSTNGTCDINSARTRSISSNHLVTFALRPAIENNGVAYGEVIPLKNLQNHNHNQTPTPSRFAGIETPQNRQYCNLAFPANQTNTQQEPGLIYHNNLHEIRIGAGATTVIHYPYNALAHPLSSSDLAAMGATPASSPAYSDRVSKMLFGYNCTTYNGNPTPIQNGTMLCSWLSGNSQNSQWVDRWYDSNSVTQGDALLATVTANGSATSHDYVFDVISSLTFQPGVAYNYFRQGAAQQSATLQSQVHTDTLVKIDDWYPPTDTSVFQHHIAPYNLDLKISDQPFESNGINSIAIATTPQMAVEDELTMSAWVYAKDWSDVNANQLFGHFHESGAGVFFDTGASNLQTITYGDSNYGFLTTLNNQYEKHKQIKLATDSAQPGITNIATTRNLTKWVLDASNRIAYCVDYNNMITASVHLPLSAQYQQLQVDSTDAAYTLDTISHTVIKMTTVGIVSSISVDVSANNFVIDNNDHIVTSFTNPDTTLAIDSNNALWRIVGNNVYKNNQIVFHSGNNTSDIAIDIDDNVWVSRGPGFVYKLNNNGSLLLQAQLPRNINSNTLHLNLIREQPPNGKQDFVLVTSPSQNKMIKLSLTGKIITCIDLGALANVDSYRYPHDIASATRGDITGYEIGRKFVNKPQITAKVRVQSTCDQQVQTLSTSIAASALTPGWHHFALAFSSGQGSLQLFVDGIPFSTNFQRNTYLVNYKYNSPIVLCNDSGKFGLLKDELGFTNTSGFIGLIDQLRYYKVCLQQDQVRALMAAKTPFNDLLWVVHTNSRYPQVEHVKSWFTHRLQTHKSNAFDVTIKQLNIDDTTTRAIIENAVTDAIERIKPGYTQLRRIKWV